MLPYIREQDRVLAWFLRGLCAPLKGDVDGFDL
jgi:hypothetical protein